MYECCNNQLRNIFEKCVGLPSFVEAKETAVPPLVLGDSVPVIVKPPPVSTSVV